MNKLDQFIKEINLVLTNTIKKEDFCKSHFDISKTEINYDNAISLYKLVYSFNKLYLSFKKEYETLGELKLGEYVDVVDFIKEEQNKYRNLTIYITKPNICNDNYTTLYLIEEDTKLSSFVTNRKSYFDKNCYQKNIDLGPIKIKKYLDLFEKYELLLETYIYLKNKFVFGDGTNTLFTRIGESLLNGLNYFEITYGSSYLNTEYFIKLFIDLRNNLKVDYDKSKIVLDNEYKSIDEESINKLLNNTHIHKSYLKRK